MEWQGLIHGYFLGCFTALISFIRSSRMFHPRGVVLEAAVESDILPSYAIVRLSSAWWKKREWPDALGIAIRFSDKGKVQDLLFASFSSPLLIFFSPLLTNFKDFFENTYYGVGYFERNKQTVKYQLEPKRIEKPTGSRKQRLEHDLLKRDVVLILKETNQQTGLSTTVASIRLIKQIEIDQEALRFSAFQNDFGIIPRGYLQYLRVGTYKMSQWARPKHDLNHAPGNSSAL